MPLRLLTKKHSPTRIRENCQPKHMETLTLTQHNLPTGPLYWRKAILKDDKGAKMRQNNLGTLLYALKYIRSRKYNINIMKIC